MSGPRPRADDANRTTGIPWNRWRADCAALAAAAPRRFDPRRFARLDEWETSLRARVFDLLSEPPRPREAASQVLSEVSCNGYIRREVEYATTGNLRTHAWVLVPDAARGARGACPGAVALHDCGGLILFGRAKITEVPDPPPVLRAHWDRCYAGRPFASELARRGYVVLVSDMFGYGDRRLHDEKTAALEGGGRPFDESAEDLNDLHSAVRHGAADSLLLAAGRSLPGMVVWDDITSVNVLAAQPEVDPARIGCIGLSCGGWRAVLLSALDTRIACSVPVGWLSTLLPIVLRRPRGSLGAALLVPALTQDADFPHLAALAAPRPVLSIQGLRDKHFPPEAVAAAWEILREVYARRGAEERFRTLMYDAPHLFDTVMQEEAFAWLDRWLR